MQPVNVRNLEQIQEGDATPRRSRLGALFLSALASAAIATSFVVMTKRSGPPAVSSADPLSELVSKSQGHAPAERLDGQDVSFPGVLSDKEKPTTALATLKDERGRLIAKPEGATEPSPAAPPPATDRLPVVKLPVGTMLGATPVTTDPKDPLTAMAAGAARQSEDDALGPAGADGGYQLQVASFKDMNEADRLVEDLRRRGHRAFRQAAYVPERGLWYRVRIGPFKTRFEAQKYKGEFEQRERVSPFLVDPEKVKQTESMRAARIEAEERRARKKAAAQRDVIKERGGAP